MTRIRLLHQHTVQLLEEVLGDIPLGADYKQRLLQGLSADCELEGIHLQIDELPRLTCEAVGGDPAAVVPVVTAWRCLRLVAKLLDDVEDEAPQASSGETINQAVGLLWVAHLVLEQQVEPFLVNHRHHCLMQQLHRTLLRAGAGQHADLTTTYRDRWRTFTAADWLAIARTKSGELLAWAAWAGAWMAGADEASAGAYRTYGMHLGVLLQVADDFNDVWHANDLSDLAAGCPTLPVCYARSVLTEESWQDLEALLARATQGDRAAEVRASEWLTDLGAQSYLLVVARVQQQQALVALRQVRDIWLPQEPLVALLDSVFPALRYLESKQ